MELFDFPFDVIIWGTVSDWTLTVVTIVTLYFFYKTFKSQILVQNTQVDLLRIEIDRFLKESHPFFLLTKFEFSNLIKDRDSPNLVFHFLQKGEIELVNFTPVSDKNFEYDLISEYPDKVRSNDSVTLMFFIKKETSEDLQFTAFLFFEDRYKNTYRQVLHAWKDLDNNVRANLSEVSKNDRVAQVFKNIK